MVDASTQTEAPPPLLGPGSDGDQAAVFAEMVAARLLGPLRSALCRAPRAEEDVGSAPTDEAAEETPTKASMAAARHSPWRPDRAGGARTRSERPSAAISEDDGSSAGSRSRERLTEVRSDATDLRQLESCIGDELLRGQSIRTEWSKANPTMKPTAVTPVPANSFISAVPSPSISKGPEVTSIPRIEQIRQMRVLQLTNELSSPGIRPSKEANRAFVAEVLNSRSCLVLRVCGILPWDFGDSAYTRCRPSVFYQRLILLGLASITGTCLWRSAHLWDHLPCKDCAPQLGSEVHLLSDVPVATCALMGMLALGTALGSTNFCNCNLVLLSYMRKAGFLEQWEQRQRRETAIILASWTCVVLLRVLVTVRPVADVLGVQEEEGTVLDAALFAVASALLMGLVYCVLYVCNGLTGILDLFGQTAMSQARINGAVHEWNVLQAVLRKASGTLEWTVLVLQVGALATLVLGTLDAVRLGTKPVHIVPTALVTTYIIRGFARVADITDKCARVPSLVNSLFFGKRIDMERQYVVQYIKNSAAGFHVFETRFTSALVFEYIYMCCVVAMFAPQVF